MKDMRTTLLAVITMLLSGLAAPVSAQRCLAYERNVVTLTGKLHSQVFAGPPNYESIRKGDRKETALLVTLTERLCTVGGASQEGDEAETNIREIQLVVQNPAHWKTIQRLMGKRVQITGSLFHAFTGHHRTKVLIEVASIRALA